MGDVKRALQNIELIILRLVTHELKISRMPILSYFLETLHLKRVKLEFGVVP